MIMDTGSGVLARLLAGDTTAKPNYLYIEFKNVSSASTTVAAPSMDGTEGVDYYTGLSGTTDYVRVPIVMTPEVSDSTVSFCVMSTATEGEHSLAFSSSSKIYGLALVNGTSTASSDTVVARKYLDANDQIIRPTGTLFIKYDITL